MIEFMPEKYQAGAIIISNSGRGMALILGALFFLEISKHQFWLFFVNVAIIVLTIQLILLYFPESPKYFYMAKKYRKARDILIDIGQAYSHKEIRAVFKEEAQEKHLVIDENYMENKEDE